MKKLSMNENLLSKYLPNTITLFSLCCGLTSIRYSINNEWKIAIFLIILASIFDFFDGWFAKKLRGEGSFFGAELDSLSDVISFGVAPSIFIYFWSTNYLGSFGWSITLFFVICSALRLARFTADIYLSTKDIDSNKYFIGIPSPAAAYLSLLPFYIYIDMEIDFFQNPYLNIINLLLVSLLMISKIPTLSIKSFNFKKKYSKWIILLIAIICISLFSNVWKTLIILGVSYVLSIVYTVTYSDKIRN
ncbi:MAG: hypothetical protein CFH19_00879 [Alphaproteobacteria bacterium MarineAlpha5_Bin9]|nr:MAG: hypothetical protein CFH19_00879 [Alphaproteobacteria bacterium MarineAlpha5_Bin9]|tara:strand:+ start:32115 stop:32855 length:741 start_codon:yes stop_codon:yes gene_type:complete